MVGKGAFGKVMLVKKKAGAMAGNVYAMKVRLLVITSLGRTASRGTCFQSKRRRRGSA